MRLFIAVECPAEVRDALLPLQRETAACGMLKAVEYENLHVTLKFLGEVGEDQLGAIKSALSLVRPAGFKATVRGVGAFPNPGNPKVVWAGIGDGFDQLVDLNGRIDAALKPLGFEPDERFHPHITLARVKGAVDKGKLKALLAAKADTIYGSWEVGEFKLIESRLTPEGPIYSEAASFAFE